MMIHTHQPVPFRASPSIFFQTYKRIKMVVFAFFSHVNVYGELGSGSATPLQSTLLRYIICTRARNNGTLYSGTMRGPKSRICRKYIFGGCWCFFFLEKYFFLIDSIERNPLRSYTWCFIVQVGCNVCSLWIRSMCVCMNSIYMNVNGNVECLDE